MLGRSVECTFVAMCAAFFIVLERNSKKAKKKQRKSKEKAKKNMEKQRKNMEKHGKASVSHYLTHF